MHDKLSDFFLYWGGFAFIIAALCDYCIEESTRFAWHPWILCGVMSAAIILALSLCIYKWQK